MPRKKYYDKRVISSYDWFLSQGDDCTLVCVQKRWLPIIQSYAEKLKWSSSWYVGPELSGPTYESPNQELMTDIDADIGCLIESLQSGYTMNCEDLINITVNAGDGGCGCNSDCPPPYVPDEPRAGVDEPPYEPPIPNEPPPDWPKSTSEYEDYLCQSGWALSSQASKFLSELGEYLDYTTTTAEIVSAIIAVGGLKFPPALVPSAVIFVISAVSETELSAFLLDLNTAVDDLDDDIACCVFNSGGSGTDAKRCIDKAIDGYSGLNGRPLARYFLKEYVYSQSLVNQAVSGSWAGEAFLDQNADCSGCGSVQRQAIRVFVNRGTLLVVDSGTLEFEVESDDDGFVSLICGAYILEDGDPVLHPTPETPYLYSDPDQQIQPQGIDWMFNTPLGQASSQDRVIRMSAFDYGYAFGWSRPVWDDTVRTATPPYFTPYPLRTLTIYDPTRPNSVHGFKLQPNGVADIGFADRNGNKWPP